MTKSEMDIYNKSLRYTIKFKGNEYKDLVHDAYLRWFNKTGTSLFAEPETRVMHIIKLTHLSQLQSLYFKWRGMKKHKEFIEFCDSPWTADRNKNLADDVRMYNPTNNHDVICGKELTEHMELITTRDYEVYTYLLLGYNQTEIANLLGITQQAVNYHVKRIRKHANEYN